MLCCAVSSLAVPSYPVQCRDVLAAPCHAVVYCRVDYVMPFRRFADYLFISAPLIAMAFAATGAALSMLLADMLLRVDVVRIIAGFLKRYMKDNPALPMILQLVDGVVKQVAPDNYSLSTIHCPLITAYRLLPTSYYLSLPTHHLLPIAHRLPLTSHSSLPTVCCLLSTNDFCQNEAAAKRKLYVLAIGSVFTIELAPLLTALLLAGRIGGSYAGEVFA